VIPSAALRQALTITPRTGEGAAGPLYGGPVTYRARIEAKHRQSRDASGIVRTSDFVATLRPDAAVATGDQALVDGSTFVVLKVTPLRDLTRLIGYEVELGSPGGQVRR
jgi:hypothetical protein